MFSSSIFLYNVYDTPIMSLGATYNFLNQSTLPIDRESPKNKNRKHLHTPSTPMLALLETNAQKSRILSIFQASDPTIKNWRFNTVCHPFSSTQPPVTTLAAVLQSSPLLFRVENILGHTCYIHTAVFTVHKLSQLLVDP